MSQDADVKMTVDKCIVLFTAHFCTGHILFTPTFLNNAEIQTLVMLKNRW